MLEQRARGDIAEHLSVFPVEPVNDVAALERDLFSRGESEVASTLIGEKVMEALKVLDKVAYIRFASVYRSFRDVESFQAELRDLLAK